MSARKKLYSYIKKPFAKNGWASLALAAAAFALTQGLVYVTVTRRGEVGMPAAALGVCAILLNLAGAAFGAAGMAEKEKNYVIVLISFVLEIAGLLEWVFILR